MGFQTTVVVHNDSLDAIEEDPRFGRHLADAIRRTHLRSGPGARANVPARSKGEGVHANAAIVIAQHHCDVWMLVLAGGNSARSLSDDEPWSERVVIFLRNVAERHGFTLTRKRKPATRAARGAGAR